jgi:hypothetical protein
MLFILIGLKNYGHYIKTEEIQNIHILELLELHTLKNIPVQLVAKKNGK